MVDVCIAVSLSDLIMLHLIPNDDVETRDLCARIGAKFNLSDYHKRALMFLTHAFAMLKSKG